MEKGPSIKLSHYIDSSVVLTTKHAKSRAIAPAFLRDLGAKVTEYLFDTDTLGTFSGEIERKGNMLECARHKCELGLKNTGAYYGLASEGSFGPHPYIPFVFCDHEVLYFIDRQLDFHLYLSLLSTETNYLTRTIDCQRELEKIVKQALFPSHALIVRPNAGSKGPLFKGINTHIDLEKAFKESLKYSQDGKVWIETDMRADMNPSRMAVIGKLADDLAQRLSRLCPKCKVPGWGKVRIKKGLRCRWCDTETELVQSEIFGCTKCDYEEIVARADGLTKAGPENCPYCNP